MTSSECPECADAASARSAGFTDLSVVPEGDEGTRSGAESPCTCEDCHPPEPKSHTRPADQHPANNGASVTQTQPKRTPPNTDNNTGERTVDVLVHDAPNTPRFFESITSAPHHTRTPPPPPGFILSPYQTPRFHTGGNVEDLLGDVQGTPVQTTFIQQNSVFMCNTKRVIQQQRCCQQQKDTPVIQVNGTEQKPKCYVTEKNIELTYDYPRSTPVNTPSPKSEDHNTTTTEVASTVVFVERRIPVRPRKFDFFFRSRSAPVGDNEEPIYATVNKLPKRLRRMELANLEKEVAYKSGEQDSSTRTEVTLKTDSESQAAHPDDDTSPSEREKSVVPQRPESPKAKKRKRFSLTFKKRERKRREKKKEVTKNGAVKNGGPMHAETDSVRLIDIPEAPADGKHKHCARHKPRNTLSSSSSGPRYKRDSYQEMTTSHSEHEHSSICSSINSLQSTCTHARKLSAPPNDATIPWCGCWGAGCV